MFEWNTLRRFAAPLHFMGRGEAGGLALILSSALALLWANSPQYASYDTLLHSTLGSADIRFWVDDGLMAIFFLLVGLELRREMTIGELASPSRLAAPAIAAIGGMFVPAVIFSAFNYQDRIAMRGWAIPVATDIAFALAVLHALGRRAPPSLTVFLAALAIIDDLGAIIVIALFYSDGFHPDALAGAAALLALLWFCGRLGVKPIWLYLLGGLLLWMLVLRSGLNATLSGVAIAFVVPSKADRSDGTGPALRLQQRIEPLVAYGVLPLFGLVNAGLRFDALPRGIILEPLVLGTAAALVFGKQIGVFGSVMLAARMKLATLPSAVTNLQLYGVSVLCGIGFTMSLFIGNLAFTGSSRENEVKLAVFASSAASAVVGAIVLAIGARSARRKHS